ncbi:hypothetical protein ARMSODRAFT_979996 [Armillaria solidipes]|uniref:Uncharacterized protein n=1 Tax=Armillaria solidipes TaxID=1076256 RepID=A0A2H3B8J0_9AGAR|nr:hypothetical protein ARMSODRAFT_979996 [Armillaria solidipes]
MSSPTRNQDRHWADCLWCPTPQQPTAAPLPTFQTLPTNFPHGRRYPIKMQLLAPVMYQGSSLSYPLPPPWRNTTGTYGLGMNTSHPLPMIWPTDFQSQRERWSQSSLISGWVFPQPPLNEYSYDLPLGTFRLIAPAAQMATPTLTPRTPSPKSKTHSPNSERTMTPSTPTGLTTSGPSWPQLIEDFSDLSGPKPGNFDIKMLNPIPPSLGPTSEKPWTSTSLSTEEDPYPSIKSTWPSRPEYSPIMTKAYTILRPDTRSPTYGQEPPRSSTIWRSPYTLSPYSLGTISNEFDTFHYNYGTFRELDDVTP